MFIPGSVSGSRLHLSDWVQVQVRGWRIHVTVRKMWDWDRSVVATPSPHLLGSRPHRHLKRCVSADPSDYFFSLDRVLDLSIWSVRFRRATSLWQLGTRCRHVAGGRYRSLWEITCDSGEITRIKAVVYTKAAEIVDEFELVGESERCTWVCVMQPTCNCPEFITLGWCAL